MIKQKNNNLWIISTIIFFLINHFSNYQIIHFDGNGYMAILISCLIMYAYKEQFKLKVYFKNFAIVIWACLMIYHIINAYIKGSVEGLESQSVIPVTIINILLMVLTAYLYNENKTRLFWTLMLSLSYYLIIAYKFGEIKDDGRFSGFLYTTQLGQMSGVLCIIISLFINYKRKFIYSVLYIFPVSMMLLSGSRNGLIIVVFSIVVLGFPYFYKQKYKIIIVALLSLVFIYYLQDSLVIERTDNNEEVLQIQTGTIFDYMLGDRIIYYYIGWDNFIHNPIFGIGLLNFSDYNKYQYPIHSEPMTHLAEGGVIGATMYLAFKLYFIAKFKKYCSTNTLVLNQCLIAFIALITIGLSARIFHYEFFFPLYGIIIGEFYKQKQMHYESSFLSSKGSVRRW